MNQETNSNVTYVAMGVNVWGKASTMEEAIKNAQKAGWYAKPDKFNVYRIGCEQSEVNVYGDGSIGYKTDSTYELIQESVLVKKNRAREEREAKKKAKVTK